MVANSRGAFDKLHGFVHDIHPENILNIFNLEPMLEFICISLSH